VGKSNVAGPACPLLHRRLRRASWPPTSIPGRPSSSSIGSSQPRRRAALVSPAASSPGSFPRCAALVFRTCCRGDRDEMPQFVYWLTGVLRGGNANVRCDATGRLRRIVSLSEHGAGDPMIRRLGCAGSSLFNKPQTFTGFLCVNELTHSCEFHVLVFAKFPCSKCALDFLFCSCQRGCTLVHVLMMTTKQAIAWSLHSVFFPSSIEERSTMRTAERPLVLPQLLPYWDVGPELDFFFFFLAKPI
jgi:hypothetical protein